MSKKHLLKLDDVTNNDVLGFDSRLLTDIIAPILTTFYNVSIETQSIISDWKLSKVTPIMGKGSKDDAGNHRPISLIGHMGHSMSNQHIFGHFSTDPLRFF